MMSFESGFEKYLRKKRKSLPTDDSFLDRLLNGGINRDLSYLFYGDLDLITRILYHIMVNAQQSEVKGGFGCNAKVAFVDGYNKFNPYDISKIAVSKGLSPTRVLENILISRSFSFEQIIETLENRLSDLQPVKILIVSGFTNFMSDYSLNELQGVLSSLKGVKVLIAKHNPIIILTTSLNKFSQIKPKGGRFISHFCHCLVLIKSFERYIEYRLVKHPFQPEIELKKRIPLIIKLKNMKQSLNLSLDEWIH